MQKQKVSLFWFRRDLRLEDNVGLSEALSAKYPVLPIFIFDKGILEKFEGTKDRRIDYFHQALQHINTSLKKYNSHVKTFYGHPLEVFKLLLKDYDIQTVYANRDYEPEAVKRDKELYSFLKKQEISFKGYKDQVIFDKDEILTNSGTPYKVYTPYAKKWRSMLQKKHYAKKEMVFDNFLKMDFSKILSLNEMGYEKTDMNFCPPELDALIINDYDKTRDYPAENGTTHLGIALRFGTISIRRCVAFALKHNETWLSELIWREFFIQILYHFPRVVNESFKKKYDTINWRNIEEEFDLWCQGKTGFPLVDAGMRELNQTGYMHNRVRMLVASFLVKDLLIDWRWGEAYFAQKLNDYELSSNNGNWQWAAGSGCDAAPYFRVFNPTAQIKKFDKDLKYIKKWIPEFETSKYADPIVNHKEARKRALAVYGQAVKPAH